ncbi:S-layer homology domain-containing protein [Anaerotignum faecicola]|nr:S-layer homology domain-containing protein [Anaerotignum faecicola]
MYPRGGAFDSQSSTVNGAAVYTSEDTVDDTSADKVNVRTKDELKAALANNDVNIIYITDSFKYTDSIATGEKTLVVNEGVTLETTASQISGTIVNNGTIKITGSGQCIWTAQTTGTGKIVADNQKWGEYQTYVDYGCVPDAMLEGSNCRINIVKDVSIQPTVSLPSDMKVGDTITPTFTNIVNGVDLENAFKFKWENNGNTVYNGAVSPTLTKKGTLKLTVSVKKPYVMRSSSGSYGISDVSGTVKEVLLDTVYVNANSGNNNNIGNTKAAPMKTIGKAIDKVNDGGTIILLSDYTSTALSFDKNVTIKSDDGGKYTVQVTREVAVKDDMTVTFDSVNVKDFNFTKYYSSSVGSGNVVFKNCTGSGIEIADNVISNVTLENSQLGGRFGAQGTLTLKNATINGSFSTKDFVAKGENIYVPEDNRSKVSRIEGTATIEKAVEIQLSAPDATTPYQERKLIETTADASNFTVSSPYQLKKQTEYNGTYIYAFIPVTSVTLAPETLSIEEGKTAELTATISPANATTQQHSWASENGKIAKAYGKTLNTAKVTAIGVGKTTITYTIGGKEASCEVTVTPRTISVESITLNKPQLSLVKGATETLTATVLPTTATDKTVIWESSDTAVATVKDGIVTAVAAGNATITAKAGEKTATCAVTVTNPSNSGSSSGGGSSTPRYAVTVPDKTENGSLSVSSKNAKKGSDVTITATPDKGYEVDDIVAKDAKGNKLTLKDNGDGTYTFTMPASKVTVTAAFAEKKAEPIVPEKLFADVSAEEYYYEAVKWASENGVTGGIGENLFGAKLPCTRAQIVTFLWRAAGSPEPKGMSGFVDVSADAYYAKAVAWAVEQGIVSGTSATTFNPDAVCTRAQSVAFLYRAFGEKVNKAAGFSDVSADAYYADAVAWAVENGVASGIGGGLFAPDQDCARGQIVAFLYRAYQNK